MRELVDGCQLLTAPLCWRRCMLLWKLWSKTGLCPLLVYDRIMCLSNQFLIYSAETSILRLSSFSALLKQCQQRNVSCASQITETLVGKCRPPMSLSSYRLKVLRGVAVQSPSHSILWQVLDAHSSLRVAMDGSYPVTVRPALSACCSASACISAYIHN